MVVAVMAVVMVMVVAAVTMAMVVHPPRWQNYLLMVVIIRTRT